MLTRDQILTASDIRTEEVPVPEWGGAVRIRAMTGGQREEFETWCHERMQRGRPVGLKGVKTKLVVMSVVDEQGQYLFRDEDIPALAAKSGAAIGRVFDAAMRLNALSREDAEDLAGNSAAGPTGDSGSI